MESHSSYPKANFNDLLAEWIDSFATYKECDYSRREDGTYNWVDWCTHGGEDFDKFIRSRRSPIITKIEKKRKYENKVVGGNKATCSICGEPDLIIGPMYMLGICLGCHNKLQSSPTTAKMEKKRCN